MLIRDVSLWFGVSFIFNLMKKKYSIKQDQLNVTLIHSTLSPTLSGLLLMSNSIQCQTFLINLNKSYFVFDLLKMIHEKNIEYIAHHLISLVFIQNITKYKYYDIYNQALFLGEITNPLFRIWKYEKQKYKLKKENNFKLVNTLFTGSFTIIRGLIIPYSCYKSFQIIKADDKMDTIDLNLLISFITLFNIGNVYWIYKLIKGYYKFIYV